MLSFFFVLFCLTVLYMDGDIYKQFSVRPNGRQAPIAIQSASNIAQFQQWCPAGSNIAPTVNHQLYYPPFGSSINNQLQIQSASTGCGQWTIIQDTGLLPALQINQQQAFMNVQPQSISSLYNSNLPHNVSSNYHQPTTAGSDGLRQSSVLPGGGDGTTPSSSSNGAIFHSNYSVLPYGSASLGMPFNVRPVISQAAGPMFNQMQLQVNSAMDLSTGMSAVPQIRTSVGQAFVVQSVPVHAPDRRATQFTAPPGTIYGMPGTWPNIIHGVPHIPAGQLVVVSQNPSFPVEKVEPDCSISQGNGLVTNAAPSMSVNCDNRFSGSSGLASNQSLSSLFGIRPPVCVTTPCAQNSSAIPQAGQSPIVNALLTSKEGSSKTKRSCKRKLSSSSESSSDSHNDSNTTKRDSSVSRQSVYGLRSRKKSTPPRFVNDQNNAGTDDEEVAELDEDDHTDPTWKTQSRKNMTSQEDEESDVEPENSAVDTTSLRYTKAAASIQKKITNYEEMSETGDSLAFVMECYDDSYDVPDVRTRKTSQPVLEGLASKLQTQLKNGEDNTKSKVSTLSKLNNLVNISDGAVFSVFKNMIELRAGHGAKKPSSDGIAKADDVVIVDAVPAPTSHLSSMKNMVININNSKSAQECSSTMKAQSTPINVCKEKRMPNNLVLSKASLSSSTNKCTGVHLQLLFFRLDENSPTVNRLIGWQKSESSMVRKEIVGKTHERLCFQCVFCPFVDTSTRRIAAHVKVRHKEVIFALTTHAFSSERPLLFLFCRHCNFVTYDDIVMLLHFHTYHSLSHVVCDSAFCPNTAAAEAGRLDPNDHADAFPYYCCTSCSFMSAQKVYATDHVATEHASKFANCFVPLVMVGQPNGFGRESYVKHANDERFATWRKNIFACVRCPYFSFNSYEALSHNLRNHRTSRMVFICDVIHSSCNKRFSSGQDALRHLQSVHAKELRGHVMSKLSVTLVNLVGMVPVEYFFAPGKISEEYSPSEVAVRRQVSVEPSSSTFIEIDDENVSASKVIEIVDDNDDDDDDDVLIIDNVPTNLSDKTRPSSQVTVVSNEVNSLVASNENIACSVVNSLGVSNEDNSLGVGNENNCIGVEAHSELNSIGVDNETNSSVEKQISTDSNEVCSINLPERNLITETVSVTCCEKLGSAGSSSCTSESSAPSDRGIELPSKGVETSCVNVSVSFKLIDRAETDCFSESEESNTTISGCMVPGSAHDETITSNQPSVNVNLVINTDLACAVNAPNDCEVNVCSSIFEASQTNFVVKGNNLDNGELQDTTYTKQPVVVTDLLPAVQNCTSCTDLASHCVWANGDYLDDAETFLSSSECGNTVGDCGEIAVGVQYVVNTNSLVSNSPLTNDISMCDKQQTVSNSCSSLSSAVDNVSLNSTLNRSKFKRLASYRFVQTKTKTAEELTTADSNQGDMSISSLTKQSCVVTAEELSQLNELP